MITILIGVPASGKTTYCANYCMVNPDTIHINKDSIRSMVNMNAEYNKSMELVVRELNDTAIKIAYNEGFDAIVDNTNLYSIEDLDKHFTKLGIALSDVKYLIFITPSETCLHRNNNRTGLNKVSPQSMGAFIRKFNILKDNYKESNRVKFIKSE